MRDKNSNGSGLFGDFFDLNGDGKTDAAEAALMFMMFDEFQKEDQRRKSMTASGKIIDLDDMDIGDGVTDLDDMDIDGI